MVFELGCPYGKAMTQTEERAREGPSREILVQVRTSTAIPFTATAYGPAQSSRRRELAYLSLVSLLVAGAMVTSALLFFGSATASGSGTAFPVQGPTVGPATPADANRTNGTNGLSIVVTTTPIPANGSAPLTVAFHATLSGGAPPYGANWNFGDGSLWGQGLNVSHTYSTSGRYAACAYGYDQKNASATQCVSVRVSGMGGGGNGTNNSSLSLRVSTTPSPPSGLVPLKVQFEGTVSGGAPPYDFDWSFGDNRSVNGTNASVSEVYLSAGTYRACGTAMASTGQASTPQCVQVIAMSNGNGNGTNGTSNLSLTIKTSPSVPTGPAPLSVTFVAGISGGSPPYGVNWNFGDGTWGYGLMVNHTYPGVGTFTACGNAYDSLNHSVTQCVNVTVQSNSSSLAVKASSRPLSGSAPLTVEFWANVTGGMPPYVIAWTFGDGGNGSGAPIDHTYALPGDYTASVVVTDSSRASVVSSVNVQVGNNSTNAPLAVTLNILPDPGIAPLNVSIQVQATGGTPYYSLKLSTGNGNQTLGLAPWSGAPTNFQVYYPLAGFYTVTAYVVDAAGSVTSQRIPLDLGSRTMSVGLNVTPVRGSAPLNVTFTIGKVSGGLSPYLLTLAFGDGAIAHGLVPGEIIHHVYQDPGTFRVVLNATSGQGQGTEVFGNILVTSSGTQMSGNTSLDSEYLLGAGAGGVGAVLVGYYLLARWRARATRKLLS